MDSNGGWKEEAEGAVKGKKRFQLKGSSAEEIERITENNTIGIYKVGTKKNHQNRTWCKRQMICLEAF